MHFIYCLLIQVHHSYIYSFYFFHQCRFCQCPLLRNLLFFWPNLRLWQLLLLFPCHVLPQSLSFCFSSFLLFFQCLSRFTTFSYHCSIFLRGHSTSIKFLLITLFISCLNFFTNSLLLQLLSLIALLKSCTNSSIVLLSYLIPLSSLFHHLSC